MSKRLLMLSTAAVALLSSAAVADTTIDDDTTTALTTGTLLTDNEGTENAGNIIIESDGSIKVDLEDQGAVTIDSNHWLLQQGTIYNKDEDGTSAIHVDMSANPDFTGTAITDINSGGTASVTGIYLDSNSTTAAGGDGSGKYGIYLDTTSCSAVCTFTGDITMASSSMLSVTGNESTAFQLGSASDGTSDYGVLYGDLNINGAITATADTTGRNGGTSLSMYGFKSYGYIDGDVNLGSSGSIAVYGQGSVGMLLAGKGVSGTLLINGALTTSGLNETNYNYYSKANTTTNSEGGPALEIGASIDEGIIVGSYGSITSTGSSLAVSISPSFASMTQTSPITIGVYADSSNPGFSFYNRGSITAGYANYNKATAAISLAGTGTGYETILSGGFYNSGAISASAATSNDASSSSGVYAYGLVIGNYVKLLQNESVKNAAGSDDPGDQAALVNAGSIVTSVGGTRGGTSVAIWITGTSGTSVSSLINTGTISAAATTTDSELDGNTTGSGDPLIAYAIRDDSGTLTSIVNSGTISAQAGYSASSSSTSVAALENDSQIAVAIKLAGNSTGTTIKNHGISGNAIISGDIIFGAGKNQVLDLEGSDEYYSMVTGDVTFGYTTDDTSVHQLHIGTNSVLTGKVISNSPANGVLVDIDAFGVLNLQNTTTALTASTVTVAKNGTLNLAVSNELTDSGMIEADAIVFNSGSNLGVTYASFVPEDSHQFVLMTAEIGQLQIAQATLDEFNTSDNRPYLLSKAEMCVTSSSGCTRPSDLGSTRDALLIDVVMKDPVDWDAVEAGQAQDTDNYIGLTPKSIAVTPIKTSTGVNTTLFEQVNAALVVDDELGAAFLNGIHNAADAQEAYNAMAPNITGGTRAIAVSITDSATGPVAARMRALRMYGKTNGDFTLWGQEFVQMLKDPGTGATDDNTGFKTNPGFKDHGFGFSIGIDGGSPKYGWYGGALTFYQGDVNELSRNAHQNEQWYLLSLYSDWRGKGLFLDTKVDVGYGDIDSKRTLILYPTSSTYYMRQATSKHAGALIAGSVVTGAMFSYGAATFIPQLNIDAMYLRENGYTEKNPSTSTSTGDAFNLKVGEYYAKSLRAFLGFNARYDFKIWDIYLQPEARAGYRYDFVNDPVKLKAAFAYADTSSSIATAGNSFELTGPDPAQGNYVLGASIAATTDTWTLGVNFDLVKGSNGAFQQVGTVHLLGRI